MPSLVKRKYSYKIRFYHEGKQHEVSLDTTDLHIAKKRFDEWVRKLDAHDISILNDRPAFIDVWDEYLLFLESQKTISNLANYKETTPRILPYFETLFLDEITEMTISKWIVELRSRRYARESIRKALMVLKQIFRRAKRLGYCETDPTEAISLPEASRSRDISFFTQDQIIKLFDYFEANYPAYAPIFIFMLYTGLRRKETMRLQWSDVDLESRIITIRDSKSVSSNVTIPINQYALNILQNLYKPDKQGYVFPIPIPTVNTLPKRTDAISRVFAKGLLECDIKGHLHMLRHTFATHLVHTGVDISSLKGLLRHSSVKTTEIYLHNLNEHLRVAIDKFPKLK